MGRKKARRSSIKRTKSKEKIPKRFTCPECNQENVVVCNLNHNISVGTAVCSLCDAIFKCKVHKLMSAVDVYSEWVDEVHTKEKHK